MIALRLYGANDYRLEEVNIPKIVDGEVLIKVKAAALCGTDVRMIKNGAKGVDAEHPLILGHEFSGIIEESKTAKYEKGTRVSVAPNMGCGACEMCISGNSHLCSEYKALGISIDGAFAEYIRIPKIAVDAGNICKLEEGISDEEAAITEAFSCVYNGFERNQVKTGDNVLIIGSGAIGMMHGLLALSAGAKNVIINDMNEKALSKCKAVDNRFITVLGDPKETVDNYTKKRGVDVCVVACPSAEAQKEALEVSGYNARINFFGGIPLAKEPVAINTNLIHYKQLIVSGTTRASLYQYKKALSLATSKVVDIEKIIGGRYKLEEFDKAFANASGCKNVFMF